GFRLRSPRLLWANLGTIGPVSITQRLTSQHSASNGAMARAQYDRKGGYNPVGPLQVCYFRRALSSICARSTRLAASVREREMSISRSISSSFIANSTACLHLAMIQLLVHT